MVHGGRCVTCGSHDSIQALELAHLLSDREARVLSEMAGNTEWDQELETAGVMDFPDVVLRARDHARRRLEPSYRAAIIDEAQDLTLVGLQLVRNLVNGHGSDRPDGLVIVGDGAQRIYAGGFTLRQAGVEVRGRTAVLRTNYRNTAEIVQAAMALAGGEQVDDLGDSYAAVMLRRLHLGTGSGRSSCAARESTTRRASSRSRSGR
jgi:superfamily I DNA/RNA helicase